MATNRIRDDFSELFENFVAYTHQKVLMVSLKELCHGVFADFLSKLF